MHAKVYILSIRPTEVLFWICQLCFVCTTFKLAHPKYHHLPASQQKLRHFLVTCPAESKLTLHNSSTPSSPSRLASRWTAALDLCFGPSIVGLSFCLAIISLLWCRLHLSGFSKVTSLVDELGKPCLADCFPYRLCSWGIRTSHPTPP